MRPLFEIIGRWPAWEQAAVRHGLAAWVADEMSAAGHPIPSGITQAARAQVSNGARLKRLTLAVVDALAAVEVIPVLLKGYGLASRLFPEQPFARPATDVDVLVWPEELVRAESALAKLGLRLGEVPGVEDVFEEHHHRPWSGPAGLVELHFRLFSGFGGGVFDDRRLRERTTLGTLDGRQVRWLSAEDEFLYLATHVANHGFLRISWLVDLERYLRFAPGLDWGLMSERSHEARFEVPVATALAVLERLLDVRLPVAAKKAFPSALLRRQLDARIFSAARVIDARWSNDPIASFFLRLYLVDSPGQGARHLFEGAKRYLRQRRGG
ncbi:MAG: nucleotidyltransferase family protein [Archangium sp.]|nr:nucleotidyltransferase family protein [Archangium sp.]MDP3575826.1 nucleotidyltransferase family protein [Archangium sp.]